ncbi:MAG: ribulose-phosphate 3-epimerase [Clostridia bacterium]|nr:ribulose-phosphate 3-epimerase [Clostridia bacterium]
MNKRLTINDLRHIIAPSILAADPLRLAADIERLGGAARCLHIDIMDSHYVPNMNGGPALVKALSQFTDMVLDVHLMVERPEHVVDMYLEAGADILTIHQEACRHPHRWLGRIRAAGALAGISLNPGTSLEVLRDLLPETDLVLLMTVNPGYGGQKFIPAMFDKIKRCRELLDQQDHRILLEADGGITVENSSMLWQAGLDVMVAGSSIFQAADPAAQVRILESGNGGI